MSRTTRGVLRRRRRTIIVGGTATGGGGDAYEPSLDFSDDRNSQYIGQVV